MCLHVYSLSIYAYVYKLAMICACRTMPCYIRPYSLANSLSVSEKAVLPVDTMIGNVSYQDLFATVSAFKSNKSQDNSNEQKAKSITLTYNRGDLYINLNHFTEADLCTVDAVPV